jgi:hypothetical protein
MLARVARYEVEAERIDDAVRVFGEAATEIEGLARVRRRLRLRRPRGRSHDDGDALG